MTRRRSEDRPVEQLTCRQCGTGWVIPSSECLIVRRPGPHGVELHVWFPCHQCGVPSISMCPRGTAAHALRHGAHHHDWRHLTPAECLALEVTLWNTLVNPLGPALCRELSAILQREVS